jgi:SET domain-containing protein
MALLEKQLFVKKSSIPNSGKGLFTKKFIPKGTRIVEYKGKVSAWKNVKDEDGKNGYIFYINRNYVINALPATKALARYANDARGLVKIKGITNNCDYITDGLQAFIESKKDIPAGSEIFVDYGKDYWKVIRENMKLWAKEEKEALANSNRHKKVNGSGQRKLNGTHKLNGSAHKNRKTFKKVNNTGAKRKKLAGTR